MSRVVIRARFWTQVGVYKNVLFLYIDGFSFSIACITYQIFVFIWLRERPFDFYGGGRKTLQKKISGCDFREKNYPARRAGEKNSPAPKIGKKNSPAHLSLPAPPHKNQMVVPLNKLFHHNFSWHFKLMFTFSLANQKTVFTSRDKSWHGSTL